jgi:hypothetical protein
MPKTKMADRVFEVTPMNTQTININPKNILKATVLDWRKLINPQKLKKKNNAAVLAALSPGNVNLVPK